MRFWYEDSTIRHVSIIIPRASDSIHPIPMATPDIFYNNAQDYGNNRLEWDQNETDTAFFLDYEIPQERKDFEALKLAVTITGIFMGVIIGLVGIVTALENKK